MNMNTEKKITEMLKNIISTSHENILYLNMYDKEKVIEYIKEKQEPVLKKIENICKIHLSTLKDKKQKIAFIKIIENFTKYKATIELLLKDPQKDFLLKKIIETLNEIYQKLTESINEYEQINKIY